MKVEDIKRIAVVGGGTMGQGIAQSFAQAGLSVYLIDQNRELLERSLTQINTNLNLFREYDLLTEDVSTIASRIQPVVKENLLNTAKDCHFIVEAIPESLELKKELFGQLDSCDSEIIISSNSSSIPVQVIAQGCNTPARMIGLHYFNPAHIMPW